MNIIIPLGGLGERFKKEGYLLPKPLIKILGKEMIFYVIDNLNVKKEDKFYIIYKSELDKYDFHDIIKNKYPNINLISIDNQTKGAAETIYIGAKNININQYKYKTVLVDCDTFYTTDIINKYRSQKNNAIYCFRDDQDKPIYSYVEFDENYVVREIKEKTKISDYANSGCYCFENLDVLIQYCGKIIDNNITEKGEYYVSCVINEMLRDKHTFHANIIDYNEFHCLGTPLQVRLFCCNAMYAIEPKRFCFDLDNTIVTSPIITNDYSTVRPIQKTIDYIRYLKNMGHYIIIYTARRMKTHNGNIGKINKDISKITFDTLEKFNIPYDEIYFGKPYADYYIDDKEISIYSDIEKEAGFYKSGVEERKMNQILADKMDVIIKKSTSDKLDGEIYFYNNIPAKIKHLFPILINYGTDFYIIEKIQGITLSHLYVNELMSIEMLKNYLTIINEIHKSSKVKLMDPKIKNLNIYENYVNKIKKRYESYNYSKFKDSDKIYNKLITFFDDYEKCNLGRITVIHGDPVFSNCIYDQYNNFKFIDMRGKIGNTLTIFGDKFYDYGKIYQSLIGYDEIMLDKIINNEYKQSLVAAFESYIIQNFGKLDLENIKMITNSLLFTLLPLHDNNKCYLYYKLMSV